MDSKFSLAVVHEVENAPITKIVRPEFFNIHGIHPVTRKALKPVSEYIIDKYVKNYSFNFSLNLLFYKGFFYI